MYINTVKDKLDLLYYYEEINKRLDIVQVLQNLSQNEKFIKLYCENVNNKKYKKLNSSNHNFVLINNQSTGSFNTLSKTIKMNNVNKKENNIIKYKDSRNNKLEKN